MRRFFVDTNILIYLADPPAPKHWASRSMLDQLVLSGMIPVFSPQIAYEFWTVATRPVTVNGLGWGAERARKTIEHYRIEFETLHDTPTVFDLWLDLVTTHNLKGKRIHDAHILATMQAHRVTQILTFNASDFPPVTDLSILTPAQS